MVGAEVGEVDRGRVEVWWERGVGFKGGRCRVDLGDRSNRKESRGDRVVEHDFRARFGVVLRRRVVPLLECARLLSHVRPFRSGKRSEGHLNFGSGLVA